MRCYTFDHDGQAAGGMSRFCCGLSTSDVVRQSSPCSAAASEKKKEKRKILIPSAPVRLFYARIVILKRACVS
jgi:hypothetical protein